MSQPPQSPIEIRHHSAVVSIQTSSSSVPPATENVTVASGVGTSSQPSNRKFIIQEVVEPAGVPQQQTKPAASATQSGSPECGAYCGSPNQDQHHHHHHHHHLPHPGTGGSITIMTPPTTDKTSRINICINNHFPLMEAKPDLRRHHTQFGLSEEVFVQADEGDRYFLGTIIAIGEHKCLVHFDDGTERWSTFEQLKRMETEGNGKSDPNVDKSEPKNGTGSSDEEAVVASGSGCNGVAHNGIATCVVCKEHNACKVVKQCDGCYRGYHLRCHGMLKSSTIVLDDDEDDDDDDHDDDDDGGGDGANGSWLCCRCTTPANDTQSTAEFKGFLDEEITPLTPLTSKAQLPYDIDNLDWDLEHQVNTDGHYCYCGADGDWIKEMIQCNGCDQWFHGRCIRSLQYPIFLGDRHYLFLCSICNEGHEFVRRVELRVSDLLHLVLYNLIMRNGHRLFDLNRAIVPFIEDNMRTLQLPEHFASLPLSSRREAIAGALKANSSLFVNGTEVGLAFGQEMWTLRTMEAPPRIAFSLPSGKTITENVLRKERPTLRFLPRVNLERSFITDAMSRERMTGIAYSQPPFSTPDPRADHGSEAIPQERASPTADHQAAVVNGNGSVAGTHAEEVPGSSNRRKYPPRFKLAIHPSMHACAMDEIFPPPPDYRGTNNPFHTDPDAPAIARPRVARIVKRRMSANDIGNGRGKKKKLNNGVGVMMLGPQPGTSSRAVQAPRPAANSQPVVSTNSVDVPQRSVRATRSSGNHSRNLRPRGVTNYSDRRRYRARRSAMLAEQSVTDDDTVDGGSVYLPRSRSLSVSSSSSSSSAGSSVSLTFSEFLLTLPTGEVKGGPRDRCSSCL